MGQVIQVNGDYKIKSKPGSKITLDPGITGDVLVTGNLIVTGDTVSVSTQNLEIEDNVIELNVGETGDGVTTVYSGIQIDRGYANGDPEDLKNPPASFFWNETEKGWQLNFGTPSSIDFSQGSKLIVNTIKTSENRDLIIDLQGVIKVPSDTAYELKVIENFHITNKRYVDERIITNPSHKLETIDTLLYISDNTVTPGERGSPGEFATLTGYSTGGETAVSIVLNGKLAAQIYPNRTEIGDLELGGGETRSEITTKNSITNQNILIRTQGTGKLQTNYALQFDHVGQVGPAPVSEASLIYGSTPSLGTTGIYFVNPSQNTDSNNGARYQNGELISRKRALLYSMIF